MKDTVYSNALPYSDNFLNQMRQTTDTEADMLICQIFQSEKIIQIRELMRLLQANEIDSVSALPQEVRTFFQRYSQLPSWANPSKMQNGVLFFQQYNKEILSMLGFLSLPYCYAAADGAQVLYLSQRIRKDTQRRLAETAQFVLDVMQTEAFSKNGKGFVSTLKVRLIHAAIRYHIAKSNQWNNEGGEPINQEDMAGTNLAFSWICIRGLRKMGFFIDPSQAEDFLHLWNVIGYLMGVEPKLLPENGKQAFLLDKKIAQRQFKKSEAGVALMQALLTNLRETPAGKLPNGFVESYLRFLLGNEIADLLEIPLSNWTSWLIEPLRISNSLQNIFRSEQNTFLVQVQKELSKQNIQFDIPLTI